MVLALLTGLAFGVVPALSVGRTNMQSTLRDETRGSSESRRSRRLRGALVAGQIALCAEPAHGRRPSDAQPVGDDERPAGLQSGGRAHGRRAAATREDAEGRRHDALLLRARRSLARGPRRHGDRGRERAAFTRHELQRAGDRGRSTAAERSAVHSSRMSASPTTTSACSAFRCAAAAPSMPKIALDAPIVRRDQCSDGTEVLAQRWSAGRAHSPWSGRQLAVEGDRGRGRATCATILRVWRPSRSRTSSQRQEPTGNVSLLVRARGNPLALAQPIQRAATRVDPDLATAQREDAERVALRRSRGTPPSGGADDGFGALALLLASVGVYAMFAAMAPRASASSACASRSGRRARE